ncbi:YheC/YheD family endospore coat-associated protein [Bacillus sp. EB01]|uniref:YheC/YheD family endospore coat-associated protein n=1 Tax=Bacillus sp. EB01 TaxID=1347086 RepID=UPI0018CC76F4|nr:YheC/YheD family protein [Bacillus sp. EB01]
MKIHFVKTEPDVMLLPNRQIVEYQLNKDWYWLHIGKWSKKMKIKEAEGLEDQSIGVSKQIDFPFELPDLSYEISVDDNGIHIGPVIAMILTNKKLTPKRVESLKPYFKQYESVNGLAYLARWSDFDWKTQTVKGYCYSPDSQGEPNWVSGTFPLPEVIYKRKNPPNELEEQLSEKYKGKMFNSYMFNKLEFHDALMKSDETSTYLLPTCQYTDPHNLFEMLNTHHEIYLKPVKGSLGNGIFKVVNLRSHYEVIFVKGQKQLAKKKGMEHFCEKMLSRKKYLIQKAVTSKNQNKNVDFRVIMQKDETKEWKCTTVIARYGKPKHIITNDAGSLVSGIEALETVFQLKHNAAIKKQNEVISVCKEVCLQLESVFGVYGDLGLDVIIDKELKPWVLEANKFHAHKMILDAVEVDMEIYEKIVSTPLLYAKSLAGLTVV